MKRKTRWITAAAIVAGAGIFLMQQGQPAPAGDKGKAQGPDAVKLERTRETVKMLDDLYKTAVVSITNHYVEGQASAPAILVAQDIFAAMQKKGYHRVRLIDGTGKPRNKANAAKTDFEKKAIEQMKAGKSYYEEVARVDGKDVLRAATIVPAVLKQCAVCHGKKEGALLGAISYEVPIK